MNNDAAVKRISERMIGKSVPSPADKVEFIRMIERDEASIRDFETVGGWKLAYQVADTFFHADDLRERAS